VSRRVSLPGADELFRATSGNPGSAAAATQAAEPEAGQPAVRLTAVRSTTPVAPAGTEGGRVSASPPSGRQKHDEKITVYVAPEELLALEHARLDLRAVHGLAVDRGRIVREAVAVVLADLDAKGAESILVRRLRDR